MVDTNKRAATPDIEDNQQLSFMHLFIQGNDAGKVSLEYFNPKESSLTTSLALDYNGGHSFSQPGINQTVNADQVNQYNSKGAGRFTDGNINETGEGTRNDVTKGDINNESGGTAYSGSQMSIGGSKGGGASILHDTVYTVAKKDIVATVEGSEFSEIQGDNIRSTTGNKYDIVSKGEYGIHVQGGNMDVNVQKSKFKVFSGNHLMLESLTRIQLKVGDCGIIIEPDHIYILGGGVSIQSSAGKDIVVESKNNLGLLSDVDIIERAKGSIEVKAGGTIDFKKG